MPAPFTSAAVLGFAVLPFTVAAAGVTAAGAAVLPFTTAAAVGATAVTATGVTAAGAAVLPFTTAAAVDAAAVSAAGVTAGVAVLALWGRRVVLAALPALCFVWGRAAAFRAFVAFLRRHIARTIFLCDCRPSTGTAPFHKRYTLRSSFEPLLITRLMVT